MNRDAFFRLYPNLPIAIRRETVVVLDKVGPVSWEIAFKEINAGTDLGNVILEKLFELGILHDEQDQHE